MLFLLASQRVDPLCAAVTFYLFILGRYPPEAAPTGHGQQQQRPEGLMGTEPGTAEPERTRLLQHQLGVSNGQRGLGDSQTTRNRFYSGMSWVPFATPSLAGKGDK